MKQGIVFVAWGDAFIEELERCRISVKEKLGLPTCLITDQDTKLDESKYTSIVRMDFGDLRGNGRKSVMYRASPFKESLFLDTDTVVVHDDLAFGFEQARKHGISLCYPPYFLLRERIRSLSSEDHVMYNSGVIFFKKDPAIESIFSRYEELCASTRSRTDQQFLSVAIYEQEFNPFVLPLSWNLRAHFGQGCSYIYGPIKIWHSRKPVPVNIDEYHAKWRSVSGPSKYNYNGDEQRGIIKFTIKEGRGE